MLSPDSYGLCCICSLREKIFSHRKTFQRRECQIRYLSLSPLAFQTTNSCCMLNTFPGVHATYTNTVHCIPHPTIPVHWETKWTQSDWLRDDPAQLWCRLIDSAEEREKRMKKQKVAVIALFDLSVVRESEPSFSSSPVHLASMFTRDPGKA